MSYELQEIEEIGSRDEAPLPLGPELHDRLQSALRRGVWGFFRQSTENQARNHRYSQRIQEEQIHNAYLLGVRREDIQVLLAYGESGRQGVVRKKFQELIRLIKSGQVGVVLLARQDRLSRNTPDAESAYQAMRSHGVLMMVDGRIYDPSNDGDDFVLGIYAKFWEFENRARTRWLSLTRFSKAKDLKLPIPLPSGMVWADPRDPDYVRRLTAAGLQDVIRDLSQHKAVTLSRGRSVYALPYPDADVQRAIRLMGEWLIETGSAALTIRRIRAGASGWPHPGRVPMRQGPWVYGPTTGIRWHPVTQHWLYDYLQSPALYGIYQYRAESLGPKHIARASVAAWELL